METITIEKVAITMGREADGRWWADIESMPGVMAYGESRDAAIAAVRALAFRVAADCIEHGEEVPAPFSQSKKSACSLAPNRMDRALAKRFPSAIGATRLA